MSAAPAPIQPPTVFISYAHESDGFREDVSALAAWLTDQGCAVLTDHDYRYRPPPEGWQAWMLSCIEKADVVLVVGSPKLKARYEKTAPPDSGFGATYEGAIVTQHIYDKAGRNEKFFPILPYGGLIEHIPTALRAWQNDHHFPSGNHRILKMILACGSSQTSIESASPPTTSAAMPKLENVHSREAAKRLGRPGASKLWQGLQAEFSEEFDSHPVPLSPAEIVQFFTECSHERVLDLFILVRRALRAVPDQAKAPLDRRECEEAAAALYCLAACRVVNQAIKTTGYTVQVSTTEPLICGVISTALFGGELRLLPNDPDYPRPEYIFEVYPPAGGEASSSDFERAAYWAVCGNSRAAPTICLDAGPLDNVERARLATRLHEIRREERSSLALVVRGFSETEPVTEFSEAHSVPTLLPVREAGHELLGMEPERLREEIRALWTKFQVLPHGDYPTQDSTRTHSAN